MRTGTTLLEAVVALAVLAALTAVATPPLAELRDRMEVRAARETLVGLATTARMEAIARGGARLRIESHPPAARVVAGTTVLRAGRLADPGSRLVVELSSGREVVDLPFDRLGLGRFSSATVVLRNRSARTSIVVSSYGRIRRQ